MRIDSNDDVGRRVGPGIAQTVQRVGRLEDDRSRPSAPSDAILENLERARAQDHDFLMSVPVRRVRRVTGRKRRHVHLEAR